MADKSVQFEESCDLFHIVASVVTTKNTWRDNKTTMTIKKIPWHIIGTKVFCVVRSVLHFICAKNHVNSKTSFVVNEIF